MKCAHYCFTLFLVEATVLYIVVERRSCRLYQCIILFLVGYRIAYTATREPVVSRRPGRRADAGEVRV